MTLPGLSQKGWSPALGICTPKRRSRGQPAEENYQILYGISHGFHCFRNLMPEQYRQSRSKQPVSAVSLLMIHRRQKMKDENDVSVTPFLIDLDFWLVTRQSQEGKEG